MSGITTATTPNAEIPIHCDLLRMILDLPASYRVVGARSSDDHTVHLLIAADRLPKVADGQPLHLVQPLFQRVESGQATLLRIDVVTSDERSKPIDLSALKI